MQLDLFFSDYQPQSTLNKVQVGKKRVSNDSSFSSDESPETSHPSEKLSPNGAKKDTEEEKMLLELQK